MNRLAVWIVAALMCLLPSLSGAAALWQLDAHALYGDGQQFTLTGVFSTPTVVTHADSGVGITSFVGTLDGQAAALVPVGTVSGYDYDNVFYGAPEPGWPFEDSFDNAGLLLVSDGVYFNLYAAGQLLAISSAGLDVFATGDVSLLSVSTVPEPHVWLLWLVFALAVTVYCRWLSKE